MSTIAEATTFPGWSVRVNVKIDRPISPLPDARRVAALFGLGDGQAVTLYEDFRLDIRPGEIVAVIGPSGAGKTVLLREVARQVPDARQLSVDRLAHSDVPPAAELHGGRLCDRLGILARCGLAEASTLVTPSKHLSGGQLVRLALAKALHRAMRAGRPELVIADEFASCLDLPTARILCRRLRKLIAGSSVAMLLATPRSELMRHLSPDRVILKPLLEPPRILPGPAKRTGPAAPARWPIERGTIHDYHALCHFHYLAGPPACHKRVYVVRRPGRTRRLRWAELPGPEVAAVLVVSPPVPNVRGRNAATAGRYAGPDRAAALELLNAEVECISRVVVHPMYRGCGLAVRLVRHALATASTPLVEALAAMGHVHPFFERAGMKAYRLGPDEWAGRAVSAAEAVGLTPADLAAVRPVKELLARRRSRAAAFLRREIDHCIRQSYSAARIRRMSDPVADLCRRTARRYVYYLARTGKEPTDAVTDLPSCCQ